MAAVLVAIITPIMSAGTTYLLWWLKSRKKTLSSADKAMMLLLRRELTEQFNKLSDNPSVTIDELNEFDEIYRVYHELGGNGKGTTMQELLHKKKVKG